MEDQHVEQQREGNGRKESPTQLFPFPTTTKTKAALQRDGLCPSRLMETPRVCPQVKARTAGCLVAPTPEEL